MTHCLTKIKRKNCAKKLASGTQSRDLLVEIVLDVRDWVKDHHDQIFAME